MVPGGDAACSTSFSVGRECETDDLSELVVLNSGELDGEPKSAPWERWRMDDSKHHCSMHIHNLLRQCTKVH